MCEDEEYRVTDYEGQTDDEQPSTNLGEIPPEIVEVTEVDSDLDREVEEIAEETRGGSDSKLQVEEKQRGTDSDREIKEIAEKPRGDSNSDSESGIIKFTVQGSEVKSETEKEGEESQIKERLRKRAPEWPKCMEKLQNATLYEPS